MDKIIERKNKALKNLVEKIDSLENENSSLRKVSVDSNIKVKLEILSKAQGVKVENILDEIIEKSILDKKIKIDLSKLLDLGKLYYQNNKLETVNKIIDMIVETYLNKDITMNDSQKLSSFFEEINISGESYFRIIKGLIDSGTVRYFKSYLMNNINNITNFNDDKDIRGLLGRIIDILIINIELNLSLGKNKMLDLVKKCLQSIDINTLSIQEYTDIKLLGLAYGEDFLLDIYYDTTIYDYTDEMELMEYINYGIREKYFHEGYIYNLASNRKRYLISKIIDKYTVDDFIIRNLIKDK